MSGTDELAMRPEALTHTSIPRRIRTIPMLPLLVLCILLASPHQESNITGAGDKYVTAWSVLILDDNLSVVPHEVKKAATMVVSGGDPPPPDHSFELRGFCGIHLDHDRARCLEWYSQAGWAYPDPGPEQLEQEWHVVRDWVQHAGRWFEAAVWMCCFECLALLAILNALFFRGGFLFRLLGIEVVTRTKETASRLHCLFRALVAWGPSLVCVTTALLIRFSAELPESHELHLSKASILSTIIFSGDGGSANIAWFLVMLSAVVMALGGFFAAMWPEKSLQDRIVGTRLRFANDCSEPLLEQGSP